MKNFEIYKKPKAYSALQTKCQEMGFSMPSDEEVGSLLKTLIASKPNGKFLELGTGIGLSLSWMVDGMDRYSKLVTIDNDVELIRIAKDFFGNDERIEILCADGVKWIENYVGEKFDLVFADAWPGKYDKINETLALVKPGGFYVVDDMLPQTNWPEGHERYVNALIAYLESRKDLCLTKVDWSSGILLATKKIENEFE